MTPRRVAITGLGALTGLGLTAAALWEGVGAARCAIGPIHNIPTDRLSARIACEIDGYQESDHFEPRQAALYDRVSQLSVVAGREAVAQAGLTPDDFARMKFRVGVIHAASPGQVTTDEAYMTFYGRNQQRVHPFTVPKIMNSGPCSALSIEFKAHGPCFGTASACASSTHAIGVAFDMIRAGRVDVCLTGGSDASLVPGYIKGWEALRLLSPDTARPFSRDRTGLVLGEAGTVLVLEEWDHAVARGATILAEILGFGMTADAFEMTAPNAESAAAAMRLAIEDAGLTPSDIGYINAHGTGTRLNDKTESAALKQVFNGAIPPVSSLKSQIGHCLNAAGGVETIVTTMALREQMMPATINYREPDPECDLDCVPNAPRPARIDYAMTNSFGFGGVNAVLALRRA
jgi:nodulation protein E